MHMTTYIHIYSQWIIVILSDYIIILLHHVCDVICDHVIVWHVLTCYVYKFPKEYKILKYVYKNGSIKSWHTISILWKLQVQSDHMFWCPGRRKQEDLDFDDEEEHSDDEDQGPSWHWSKRRNVAFIIFVPFSVSGCFRCLNNKCTNLLFDPCLVCIVGRSLWRKVRRWGRVRWRTLTKKPTLSTWCKANPGDGYQSVEVLSVLPKSFAYLFDISVLVASSPGAAEEIQDLYFYAWQIIPSRLGLEVFP